MIMAEARALPFFRQSKPESKQTERKKFSEENVIDQLISFATLPYIAEGCFLEEKNTFPQAEIEKAVTAYQNHPAVCKLKIAQLLSVSVVNYLKFILQQEGYDHPPLWKGFAILNHPDIAALFDGDIKKLLTAAQTKLNEKLQKRFIPEKSGGMFHFPEQMILNENARRYIPEFLYMGGHVDFVVTIQESKRVTLLMLAIVVGDADLVQLLLDAGANPNLVLAEDKITALMLAMSKAELICTQLLLNAGANDKLKNAKGQTALEMAKEAYAEVRKEMKRLKDKCIAEAVSHRYRDRDYLGDSDEYGYDLELEKHERFARTFFSMPAAALIKERTFSP